MKKTSAVLLGHLLAAASLHAQAALTWTKRTTNHSSDYRMTAASITANTARFTNLSARTVGGTGGDTLIVGFNVAGTSTRRLVIRAVGPGLAAFGVNGPMPDPKLELYSGQTKVGENDNWDHATLTAQQSLGAFAITNGSRDAVLVSTLSPGAYTVQVTGGTTGVVLVEAYEAP